MLTLCIIMIEATCVRVCVRARVCAGVCSFIVACTLTKSRLFRVRYIRC